MPPDLIRALEIAEAGLADIGDSDREPGDDLVWAESRAASCLPRIRAVLARWGRPSIEVVPVAEPEPQRPTLADEAYVAFVQICKGNSDDAGTYEADEELVRRALKRLNDLERRPTIEPVLAPPTDCSTAASIGP